MQEFNRSTVKIGALVALLATVGTTSIALAKSTHHQASRHDSLAVRAASTGTAVNAPDRALVAVLAAFERSATPADSPPVGIRGALAATRGVEDVNPGLARALGPNNDVYVMPGDGQFCVSRPVEPGSVLACSSTSTLSQGKFVGAVARTRSGYVVTGVLGDHVSDVRLTTAVGTASAPIEEGAISVESASLPSALSWVDDTGVRQAQELTAG